MYVVNNIKFILDLIQRVVAINKGIKSWTKQLISYEVVNETIHKLYKIIHRTYILTLLSYSRDITHYRPYVLFSKILIKPWHYIHLPLLHEVP